MFRAVKSLSKHSKYIKGTCVFVFAVFCMINIYYSLILSDNYSSSHEYLRHELMVRIRLPIEFANHSVDSIPTDDDRDYDLGSNRLDSMRASVDTDYPHYNISVGDVVRIVPLWQRRLHKQAESLANKSSQFDNERSYFLTELLQVRIYDQDKSRWTLRELKQWLHYMLLAGVEHIYVCDHYEQDIERLDAPLKRYIEAGLVTYIAWNAVSRDAMWAQIRCYQQLVKRYRRRHKWQIAVDIDEYPFSPSDTEENFLVRYLERLPDDVSEVSLPNYLMLDEGDRGKSKVVVDRVIRMTSNPANNLVKPVYRPSRIKGVKIHRNFIDSGSRINAEPSDLRMLHYWGSSRFASPIDRNRTLANTVELSTMRDVWSRHIENSLIVFGEHDAFSNVTGP